MKTSMGVLLMFGRQVQQQIRVVQIQAPDAGLDRHHLQHHLEQQVPELLGQPAIAVDHFPLEGRDVFQVSHLGQPPVDRKTLPDMREERDDSEKGAKERKFGKRDSHI